MQLPSPKLSEIILTQSNSTQLSPAALNWSIQTVSAVGQWMLKATLNILENKVKGCKSKILTYSLLLFFSQSLFAHMPSSSREKPWVNLNMIFVIFIGRVEWFLIFKNHLLYISSKKIFKWKLQSHFWVKDACLTLK